jgi:hypothetical protein
MKPGPNPAVIVPVDIISAGADRRKGEEQDPAIHE